MYHSQSGVEKSFKWSKKVNKNIVLGVVFLASASLAIGSGCLGLEPRSCTNEARASVNVILEEQSSGSQEDVLLEYSVNGGEFSSCEQSPMQGQPLDPGSSYVCGYEIAGDFEIRATRGDQVVTEQVTVTEDSCHVEPQVVTLTLP